MTTPENPTEPPAGRVLIVGGGIAGIGAALRLGEHGVPVTLFERRALLGGRASSFPLRDEAALGEPVQSEAALGEPVQSEAALDGAGEREGAAESDEPLLVDNCQHVLMRCCSNLLDFYNRIGAGESIRFYDTFDFVDRQNRWSRLGAAWWLPAPLHLIPSLLLFRSLSPQDKWAISRAMVRMLLLSPHAAASIPLTFGEWLSANGQTLGAIEQFWRPIVVSALNEEPEIATASSAFQLFRTAFLSRKDAFEMGLPAVELAEIYSELGGRALRRVGVEIVSGRRVTGMGLATGGNGATVAWVRAGEAHFEGSAIISAVPHQVLPGLVSPELLAQLGLEDISALGASPITGIHLWFDRAVANRPHVALLGREMQWIFARDWNPEASPGDRGKYLSLVVSASRQLTSLSQSEILRMAREAVEAVFPGARLARILRERVIREPRATFSPGPGTDAIRPLQRTPLPGFYLAGDWTRTGWPATMEGAVRSGYLAAQACLSDRGQPGDLLAPDSAPELLFRWVTRLSSLPEALSRRECTWSLASPVVSERARCQA